MLKDEQLPNNIDVPATLSKFSQGCNSDDKQSQSKIDVTVEGKTLEGENEKRNLCTFYERRTIKLKYYAKASRLVAKNREKILQYKILCCCLFCRISLYCVGATSRRKARLLYYGRKRYPFCKNSTIVVGNTTSVISKFGTDTEIYCQKFKNPNEAFLLSAMMELQGGRFSLTYLLDMGSTLSLFFYICHIRGALGEVTSYGKLFLVFLFTSYLSLFRYPV